MRKLILMGVLALIAAAGPSARAADDMNGGHRPFRYDFKCEFEDHGHRCYALARVFAGPPQKDGWDNRGMSNWTNLISVSCDGQLIEASEAQLYSDHYKVKVTNDLAAIVIKRDDKDLSSEWRSHDAWLFLGHHKLDGECQVKAQPAIEHDSAPRTSLN